MQQMLGSFEGRYLVGVLAIVYLVLTLFIITVFDNFRSGSSDSMGMRAVFIALLCSVILLLKNAYAHRSIHHYILFVFLWGAVPSLYQAYDTSQQDFDVIQLVEQTLIFITAANLNVFDFLDITFIAFVQLGFYLGFYIGGIGMSLDNVLYWLSINIFVLIKKYHRYRHEIRHFNNTNIRQKEEK
jgi:hypothetical protein